MPAQRPGVSTRTPPTRASSSRPSWISRSGSQAASTSPPRAACFRVSQSCPASQKLGARIYVAWCIGGRKRGCASNSAARVSSGGCEGGVFARVRQRTWHRTKRAGLSTRPTGSKYYNSKTYGHCVRSGGVLGTLESQDDLEYVLDIDNRVNLRPQGQVRLATL